jgi:hypothetical protein
MALDLAVFKLACYQPKIGAREHQQRAEVTPLSAEEKIRHYHFKPPRKSSVVISFETFSLFGP